MSHITRTGTWITSLVLLLNLCLPLRALDQVIGDNPSDYGSLPDLETLKQNVAAIQNGQRSVLQDSAEMHHASVIQVGLAGSVPITMPGTPHRIKRPPVSQAAKLMDLSTVSQATFANLCSRQGNIQALGDGYATVMAGANTAGDRTLVNQAVAMLDRFIPGWSASQLSRNVRIIVSDGVPNSGMACYVEGTNNPGIILVNRAQLSPTWAPWPSVDLLAAVLAHEALHIQNGARGLTQNQTENESWVLEGQIFQKEANQQRNPKISQDLRSYGNFYLYDGEQIGSGLINYADLTTTPWILYALWDARDRLVSDYGLGLGHVTLLSSLRQPGLAAPSASAPYKFVFQDMNGRPIEMNLIVDETQIRSDPAPLF